jgi:hypothetical protein
MKFSLFTSKTKLSLIDDYAKIAQIDNFCKKIWVNIQLDKIFAKIIEQTINHCKWLKNTLEKIFLKLNMLDTSFILLKSQLFNIKSPNFAENSTNNKLLEEQISQNLQIIKKIEQNLPKKLKKLAFSSLEISYIMGLA